MVVPATRSDILRWLSDLLQQPVAKIEQIGEGTIVCQVIDSIYGDVPLHKIKWSPTQETHYAENLKILQGVFLAHKIDKLIPIERLKKLGFQDNLVHRPSLVTFVGVCSMAEKILGL